MKKIAIVAAAVMVIAAFLPWVGASSSSSVSYGGHSYGSSYSSGGISGIHFGDVWLAILASIGGIVLLLKQPKFAAIPGVLCILIGLAHMMGWGMGSGGMSFSGEGFSGKSSIDIYFGLYVFFIAAIAYTIISGMVGFKKSQ